MVTGSKTNSLQHKGDCMSIESNDGKIIRDENHIDFVSLLQQIGARIETSVA